MSKKQGILIGGLLITLLAGCSSHETRKQAIKEFDYLESSLAKPISAQGTGEIVVDPTYSVPPLGAKALPTYLGKNVDVRAPSQVLTVLEGTRVEEGTDKVTVTFTTRERNHIAKDEVWTLMLNFLAQYNVSPERLDKIKGELVSNTFVFEQEFGSFWNKTQYRSEEKYKFTLKENNSARSASLSVELLDFVEYTDGDLSKQPLLAYEKQRYETGMINRLLVFAVAERQRQSQVQQIQDNAVPLELGFDDNGLPAWISTESYDKVWSKLPLALTALNFEKESGDKNRGAYTFSFKQPSDDYWREQGVRGFELEKGDYTFQVGESDTGSTIITVFDEDKKPLSVQQVSKMYLSIVDLMQKHMRIETK